MLRRPEAPARTRTFTDPSQPGVALELTLKASIDVGTDTRRDERTREWATLHVWGDAEYLGSNGQRGRGPVPLFLPEAPVIGAADRPAVITESLCFLIAALTLAQEAALDDQPYSFAEWVAFSERMPLAFREIVDWLGQLREEAREVSKNGSGATGAASSDSPSSSGQDITPSSSPGQIGSPFTPTAPSSPS
jgi:hypothetical protein